MGGWGEGDLNVYPGTSHNDIQIHSTMRGLLQCIASSVPLEPIHRYKKIGEHNALIKGYRRNLEPPMVLTWRSDSSAMESR